MVEKVLVSQRMFALPISVQKLKETLATSRSNDRLGFNWALLVDIPIALEYYISQNNGKLMACIRNIEKHEKSCRD